MTKTRIALISAGITAVLIAGLACEIVMTQPVREAMRTCSELFTVANRPDLTESERLTAARSLCSKRYLETHTLAVARGEGLVGIPRNINKNFQAWREGPNVWICPTNRIGPIYQFVYESGRWRFDGLVGLLRARGQIIRTTELPDEMIE
jgi:hypothetical protein